QGPRPAAALTPAAPTAVGPGEVVLASWRHLLDRGLLQRGEPALAATARPALARTSAATAAAHGLADGQPVTVSTGHGSITLPLAVTQMVDGVVWVPANSAGSTVNTSLRAGAGAPVSIRAGGAQ
ncbi:MAG: molybdopterin dinucleotide binding domain-containing protein, partial [Candidatus Nanopelagicales bacterium]